MIGREEKERGEKEEELRKPGKEGKYSYKNVVREV